MWRPAGRPEGGLVRLGPPPAVLQPIHELEALEDVVDGGRLAVDEPSVEAHTLDDVERKMRLDLRRLLRPGHPQRPGGIQRTCEPTEPSAQLSELGREHDDGVQRRANLMAKLRLRWEGPSVRRKPFGSETRSTRDPVRMPSFLVRGVSE